MSAEDHRAALEVVRILREQCTMMVSSSLRGDPEVVRTAEAALDIPVEEMATWVDHDMTVMANIRAIMWRVESQRVVP